MSNLKEVLFEHVDLLNADEAAHNIEVERVGNLITYHLCLIHPGIVSSKLRDMAAEITCCFLYGTLDEEDVRPPN